jgi:hypothetical protein
VPSIPDTGLFIPRRAGGAAFQVELTLEVPDQQLPDLTGLLAPEVLDAIVAAVADADQPYDHARAYVTEGITKIRAGDFVAATPLLGQGLEALFRGIAEARGLIDDRGRLAAGSARAGRKAVATDLVLALPINHRVQRMLNRFAFGDEASIYRHGGIHPRVDQKAQCLIWLLGTVAWLDAYGSF